MISPALGVKRSIESAWACVPLLVSSAEKLLSASSINQQHESAVTSGLPCQQRRLLQLQPPQFAGQQRHGMASHEDWARGPGQGLSHSCWEGLENCRVLRLYSSRL